MIPVTHYLILSGILFSIGLLGIMLRRNILLILLSIELMLNSANLCFISASTLFGDITGHVAAFFVMVVAACEVSIGLAIAVLLFRRQNSVDTHNIEWLKG